MVQLVIYLTEDRKTCQRLVRVPMDEEDVTPIKMEELARDYCIDGGDRYYGHKTLID